MTVKPHLGKALAIAAALLAIGAVAAPGFIRSRCQNRVKICQENLGKIDGAIEQWAMENGQRDGDPVIMLEVLANWRDIPYLKEVPVCPSGGKYHIDLVGNLPKCTSGLPGHSLTEICGGSLMVE